MVRLIMKRLGASAGTNAIIGRLRAFAADDHGLMLAELGRQGVPCTAL